jgi:hypothetical protein
MINLSRKERHFLLLLSEPGATIGMGTRVGKQLAAKRLVHEAKWGRWGITPAGAESIRPHMPKPRQEQPRLL